MTEFIREELGGKKSTKNKRDVFAALMLVVLYYMKPYTITERDKRIIEKAVDFFFKISVLYGTFKL